MRRSLLSVPLLSALAFSGLHCAYADQNANGCCVVRRPAPAPRLEVVDECSRRLSTFSQGGRTYVLGERGQRYQLHIVNPTPGRIEAVVSVDGLDAVDGKPASTDKRGYVVPAYGDVTIDGWRTSFDTVAAFRFSSVGESYAARTDHDRNVGVIGAAFFRERPRPHVVYAPPPPMVPESAPPADGRRAEADDAPGTGAVGSVGPAAAAAAPPSSPPARSSAVGGAGGTAMKSAPAPSYAPQAREAYRAPADERPGLGTEFGETEASSVSETRFVRDATRPFLVAELRYDDRDGLASRGIRVDPPPPPVMPEATENGLRDTADPFPASRFAEPPTH
ncbi:MAG TPA: hypothetical protein VK841_09245 [Polyangiaceae bacterium]|nr:hypothetical protein [Polyangiaceae bacterium]